MLGPTTDPPPPLFGQYQNSTWFPYIGLSNILRLFHLLPWLLDSLDSRTCWVPSMWQLFNYTETPPIFGWIPLAPLGFRRRWIYCTIVGAVKGLKAAQFEACKAQLVTAIFIHSSFTLTWLQRANTPFVCPRSGI